VPQDFSSPAWLRSTIEGGECIFLTDRTRYSEVHRAHTFQNRGLIVGEASPADRYLVACFPASQLTLTACEVCGEPNALLLGTGAAAVLYSGEDYDAAVAAYDEWFQ
jgi:hypothetical protein